MISDTEVAAGSAPDSQNEQSDNISQTPSYDSSDDEDEDDCVVETKSKR